RGSGRASASTWEKGFAPLYIVPAEKKAKIQRLKDLLEDASALYLATDEDREGESISWHLLEVLKPKVPVYRLVFHEITRPAIEAGARCPPPQRPAPAVR